MSAGSELPRNGGNINAELILAWARAAEMRGETTEAARLLDMAVREEDR